MISCTYPNELRLGLHGTTMIDSSYSFTSICGFSLEDNTINTLAWDNYFGIWIGIEWSLTSIPT